MAHSLAEIGTFLADVTLVVLLSCGTGPLARRLGYEIVRMRHTDAPTEAGMVLMLEALLVALALYVLLTAAGMLSLKWAIRGLTPTSHSTASIPASEST